MSDQYQEQCQRFPEDQHLDSTHDDLCTDHGYHSPDNSILLSSSESSKAESPAGKCFTRQQIREHNHDVGWQHWITLKGNVYHTTGFRDHFIAYNMKKTREIQEGEGLSNCDHHVRRSDTQCLRVSDCNRSAALDSKLFLSDLSTVTAKQYENGQSDEVYSASEDEEYKTEDECDILDSFSRTNAKATSPSPDFLWHYDVLAALRKCGLSMAEIETEIAPFKIGTLQNMTLPRWKYWQSVRNDVIALHDDMADRDIGEYEREYLAVLKCWLRSYGDMDPIEKHPKGDGNTNVFFLTQHPDMLRDWTRSIPPLDTELPKTGAWDSSDMLLSPLENTHDVFSAALRAQNSVDIPFAHDIEGDVAWRELPLDVITNDQMTPDQQAIHDARAHRGASLYDPERMKKRRVCLGKYFQEKYHFSEEKMSEFLQWADVMEQNQRDLDVLCSGDNVL